jgi:hypothetical protein
MSDIILKRADLSWPEKVGALAVMFKEKGDVLCPVSHRFEPGVYIREMFIPRGTYFIGRAHKIGHRVTLDAGSVRLISEFAENVVTAPYELVTVPYYQMVFEALTDVWGSTYHPNPTNCRDIDKLEAEIFHPALDVLSIGHWVLTHKLEAA